jgi:hypothetical protein
MEKRRMRTQAAVVLTASLLGLSLPAQLFAQRGRGMPHFEGPRLEAPHFTIPPAPEARGGAHAAPLVEPGRPPSAVPYVRDGRWYGHAAVDDARFHLARPFEHGRFALTGPAHVFRVARLDLGARRVWLPGGLFEVAAWDWAATAPWCWTCDDFVVYPDPDHAGWYLLYDSRMGEYVHVQFLGA